MYDWMNSGPPALDLLTPLAEGEKQGMQQAYRQDQIKIQAAREADMKARLGLDQSAQDFQHQIWESQAGQRANQLALGQAQLTTATRVNDNEAASDQAILPWAENFKSLVDQGKYTEASNLAPPPEVTSQGLLKIEGMKQQGLSGAGALEASKMNTAQLTAKLQDMATTNNIIEGARNIGLNPFDPKYQNPDGTKNMPAMVQDTIAAAQSQKKTEAENSARAIAAQIGATASMYRADKSADTRTYAVDRGTSQKILTNLQTQYENDKKANGGSLTPQAEAAWQSQLSHAQGVYDSSGGNQPSTNPTANGVPVQAGPPPAVRYINSMFSNPKAAASISTPSQAVSVPGDLETPGARAAALNPPPPILDPTTGLPSSGSTSGGF